MSLLGQMPCNSLNFVGGEDGMLVYNEMIRVYRNMLSRGWYCTNRRDGIQSTVSNGLGFIVTGNNLISAIRSRDDTITPPWVFTKVSDGTGQISAMYTNPETGQYTLDEGTVVHYDAIYYVPLSAAHQALVEVCCIKAAANLAPYFGVMIDPKTLSQASDELTKVEAQATPRYNVFTDTYETRSTWDRPYN